MINVKTFLPVVDDIYLFSGSIQSNSTQILKQLEGYIKISDRSAATSSGVKLQVFTCHELEAGPKSFSCRSERRNESPLFSFVAPTNDYMCCFILLLFFL